MYKYKFIRKKLIKFLFLILCLMPVFSSCSKSDSRTEHTIQTSCSEETAAVTSESTQSPSKEIAAYGDDLLISKLPSKSECLHENMIWKVDKVCQITGEESENDTLKRFSVWGTDLGSMTELENKIYLFCGDTFADENYGDWRSNVLFIIDDDNPSDGLTITDAIKDYKTHAKEIIGSKKRDNVEITVIPTHAFTIGETLYCYYMSVRHWGAPGQWDCNHASLAKSEDKGQTWRKLEDLIKWPGDSGFIQAASFQLKNEIYVWAIPSGRFGGVRLMKVSCDKIESPDEYVYLVGIDHSGQPVWKPGIEAIYEAIEVVNPPVGEISVIYNEYLGNFVMTYLHEKKSAIVMREGLTPWGPWGEEVILAKSSQYPALYGGFMHPEYVEKKGKIFYFAMSQYFPIYNIMWMKAELIESNKE